MSWRTLRLVDSVTFPTGVVVQIYRPAPHPRRTGRPWSGDGPLHHPLRRAAGVLR